ncbi:E3 ubiquitin-protein ligase ATL23-like [Telopea speciosissima]|uniref:E3 ubiquitin-protein ligase ATL23-like n=1 Tax=Telopea speciosissima TaxID=54955 RepID=UPI001CC7EC4C|nr:E3 ubiquitin-protein ligase ATL23-like [Telopea speciosissima]
MVSPVSPPLASHSLASSNNNISQGYQVPALPFILVPLLPVVYCILWCLIHIGLVYLKNRRGSDTVSETPAVLPVRVSGQTRQQQQQLQLLYKENGKSGLNKDCPICLEEPEGEGETKAKAETEAEADAEAIPWRLVPECCHRFHELCLNRWLKLSQTCPLCRVATELEAFVDVV